MTEDFDRLDEELVGRLRQLSTPVLADARDNGVEVVSNAITPVHSSCKFVGTARTVQLDPNALWAPIRTLEAAREGDAVVVDTSDDTTEAVWGELLSTYAKRKGIVGTVTNGAVRDVEGLRDLSYPIFAQAVVPKGPSGTEEDTANVTVTVGGATINPGDVLVGDGDGVVVVHRGAVDEITEAAERIDEKERNVQRRIGQNETLESIFESVGMA